MQHQKKWFNQMYCESSSTICSSLVGCHVCRSDNPREIVNPKMAWSFLSLSLSNWACSDSEIRILILGF